jgi:hypothetical protein
LTFSEFSLPGSEKTWIFRPINDGNHENLD